MAAPLPNALADTIEACPLGVNAGLAPYLLPRNQLAFAVNATMRYGYARTRPVLRKIDLDYRDATTERRATQALFQGAHAYEAFDQGHDCLLAAIGGRLFRFLVDSSNRVEEISIAGDLNDPTRPIAWLWQGEDFLFVNDGQSLPLIWNGATTRRSVGNAGRELPPGCMGQYVNGRIIMSLPNRRTYIAGDLVGSHGVSGAYNGRDSIIGIRDNLAILGGKAFSLPLNAGRINAISTVGIADTSLGQGPAQIGTRRGMFSVDLPLDATTWTSLQLPTQTSSLPSAGPMSQRGTVQVNADLWMRARDGLRSFSIARREFNTWVQTPLSTELDPVLTRDSDVLLEYSSGVHFDNRLLHTVSPYSVEGRGVAHRGLAALDFNNISSITMRNNPPDYDGLWTGLPILQILTATIRNQDRCFVFALDCSNNICLYELFPDNGQWKFDHDGNDNVRIESWLVSNALFGLEQYSPQIKLPLKKLFCADWFGEQLVGEVDLEFKYRSDQYPFWRSWKSFSLCATHETCDLAKCETPPNLEEQYATFRRLPQPADDCNTATGRPYRVGYYFQVRMQWTGHAALKKLLVWAHPTPEVIPACPTDETCKILAGCLDDLFTYQIETICTGTELPVAPEVEDAGTGPPPPWPEFPDAPTEWPWPQYPEQLDYPEQDPWQEDEPWPPDIPVQFPVWVPPTYVPTMTCPSPDSNVFWTANGTIGGIVGDYPFRYPSSGNEADNPNELFDAALIQWWMAHAQAAFAAYAVENGIAYSEMKLFWNWGVSSGAWNVLMMYNFDSLNAYGSPVSAQAGWQIEVAYCPV